MIRIKNALFIITLIYTGYKDQKTKIIPNFVHLIIVILSLLPKFNFWQSIMGLLILPIFFIIPVFYDENSVGGGDIKLVGAIGFFLGLQRATIAIIIGLAISSVVSIFILKKSKKELVSLAPYLGLGAIITIL